MKLYEVLSPQIPSDQTKVDPVQRGHERTLVNALIKRTGLEFETLGSGMFATGVASKVDPGTAHRISDGDHPYRNIHDILEDPYFNYIAHLAKDDGMWANPHFPKVYNIAIHQDEHGDFAFTTQLERLHELIKAEPEELHALGKRYIEDWEQYWEQYKAHQVSKQRNRTDLEHMARALAAAIEQHVESPSRSKIKDPKLKQALDVIHEMLLKTNGEHFVDLHHGNIMLRRSPHGSAIVITDPAATDIH